MAVSPPAGSETNSKPRPNGVQLSSAGSGPGNLSLVQRVARRRAFRNLAFSWDTGRQLVGPPDERKSGQRRAGKGGSGLEYAKERQSNPLRAAPRPPKDKWMPGRRGRTQRTQSSRSAAAVPGLGQGRARAVLVEPRRNGP